MPDLTEPQRRVLGALIEAVEPRPNDLPYVTRAASPRQVARMVWPDDPQWQKVPNRRGQIAGAMGAMMPQRAGRVLWALARKGYAFHDWRTGWRPTTLGREAVRDA